MEWQNISDLDNCRELIRTGRELVIFGLGRCGQLVEKHLRAQRIPVAAFCDNNKAGAFYGGIPVLRPAEVYARYPGAALIIALRRAEHIAEAVRQLRDIGYERVYGAAFLAGLARTGPFAANFRIDEQLLARETAGLHSFLSGKITDEKLREWTNPRLLETWHSDKPFLLETTSRENTNAATPEEEGGVSNGLDEIIEGIFKRLGDGGYCMEFGAHDGKSMSNTFNLIQKHGWKGIMIEPDPMLFRLLQKTSAEVDGRIEAIRGFVGVEKHPLLDTYLAGRPRLDLLSIDVDGMDYHIWASLSVMRPRVVIIEYNSFVSPDVLFVQAKNENVFEGASAAALVGLGKTKGYSLAAVTGDNLVFVDNAEFPSLGVADNSLESLWTDPYRGRLVQGFNGKIYTLGMKPFFMRDHHEVGPEDLQAFPEFSAR